jgi:16S rRNA processing protein RimM
VGRVVRPHGVGGEVVVELVSNRPERTAPGAVFDTDGGPLQVVQARPFGGRWLMRFAGVHDRKAAEAQRGRVLRSAPLVDDQALWVHELVGATAVRASDGTPLGRVVAVVSNPASDLLELEDGSLVPVRFVVGRAEGRLLVDAPAGLFDE